MATVALAPPRTETSHSSLWDGLIFFFCAFQEEIADKIREKLKAQSHIYTRHGVVTQWHAYLLILALDFFFSFSLCLLFDVILSVFVLSLFFYIYLCV